jgi:hypothetical protein
VIKKWQLRSAWGARLASKRTLRYNDFAIRRAAKSRRSAR